MTVARQFLGFAGVGVAGFAVDAGVLLAMMEIVGAGPYDGRGVSFTSAVTTTWLLNRIWVFPGTTPCDRKGRQYARYVALQGSGALINLSVFAILIETLPVMAANPLLALCVGAGIALVFNFLGARKYVFDVAAGPVRRDAPAEDRLAPGIGGSENLEVMEEAKTYNRFLVDLVDGAAGDSGLLLDFGAGTGTFARPLSDRGRNIVCVEPDLQLQHHFETAGLRVYGDLAAVPPATIDFAYTLNVLEHIDDDVAALAALRSCLKPGARLLVYVPAFDILYSAMDRNVGHVRRYRRVQLSRRLTRAGFIVERTCYVDSLGFLAALWFRAFGNDAGDIDRRALRAYDRFVFPVSRLIDRLTWPVFGKNLLLIARRQ